MLPASRPAWLAVVIATLITPMLLCAQSVHPTKTGGQLEALVRTDYTPTTVFDYKTARHQLFSNVDNNGGKVRLLYSGNLFAASTIPPDAEVNTEHVWPQSRFGTENKAAKKCNLHHLYPTYKQINGSRGNHPFAEIADGDTKKWWRSNTFLSGIPGSEIDEYSEWANGRFEPREGCKGNAARAVFYFRTIYGTQGIDLPFFDLQRDTLLAWHLKDPADAEEIERNIRIATLQGKTNPFIDDATLAQRIFKPDALPAPAGPIAARAGDSSATAAPTLVENGEYNIMTWNLEWFFDADISDNASTTAKTNSASSDAIFKGRVVRMGKIIHDCGLPHIVALQEIENNKVVQILADEINTKYGANYKVGFVQGTDTYTEQDVAYLYRDLGLSVNFSRIPTTDYSNNSNDYKVPSKHCVMSILQTLPNNETKELVLVNCHLKAGSGVEDIAQRKKQTRVVSHYLAKSLAQKPGLAVVVLGDMNTEKKYADTTFQDAMGVLRGMETTTPSDNLIDLHGNLTTADRKTHPIGELDRIMMNAVLADDVGFIFRQIVVRKDLMTGPNRPSDHTPVVATFQYTTIPQP